MDIINKVINIVRNNLDKEILFEENLADTSLDKMGMDSLSFISTIVELEEEFKIEIPDELVLLNKMNTISKIASIIEELKR